MTPRMKRPLTIAVTLFALFAIAWSAVPVAAAEPSTYSCGIGGSPSIGAEGMLLRCTYYPAPGLHRINDGGPWIHIDLLHDSETTLRALFLGTSGMTVGSNGPDLPPLGLVHSYICLSDPTVPPSQCPANYPQNVGGSYALNPAIPDMLAESLGRLRRSGLKTILRFTYNIPHGAADQQTANDAPLAVVLDHMRLLAPVVIANRDVIYALQAGFIGQWGEWHNSTNGNDTADAHNRFLDHFRALFQGVTLLEVRYPSIILDYSQHLSNGRPPSLWAIGLGIHNDAYAISPTDAGTFGPGESQGTGDYPEDILRLTASMAGALFTMEGESNIDYPTLQTCDVNQVQNIFEYSSTYSLSGLNVGAAVVPYWSENDCLTEIISKVGPHLALQSATLSTSAGSRGALQLTLQIQNTGWARLTRARPLYLAVRPAGEPAMLYPLSIDLSQILPGKSVTVRSLVPVALARGQYTISLAAPDPAKALRRRADYALLFENIDAADTTAGVSVLGSLTVPTP
jgi:hypothetical protein